MTRKRKNGEWIYSRRVEGGRIFTLNSFAKHLGYSDARDGRFKLRLKILIGNGKARRVQSGFKGDSTNHKVLIFVADPAKGVHVAEESLKQQSLEVRDLQNVVVNTTVENASVRERFPVQNLRRKDNDG
jgi:hypothetical protein